ncbi:WD40 repeat domain-containing protein [Rubinisphaera italica]|uniref:WD domain, G-beta repeat n=1 Tax=Rubinisphaera italica TaxID=2527969 RepID=A0A5C5XEC6_9PLAN|nr:WD40 repeat domain-containing protein [Rubinisphaera italica]TWT60761.1 hypothetical protein Pan54_14880 [Rubinisphaera italica]
MFIDVDESDGEEKREFMITNTLNLRVVALLVAPIIAWFAILDMPVVEAQEAKISEQQKDLDLSGAENLTYSRNREFVVGLTRLYGDSGPGSLIKIWSVAEQRLLHQFRVPGSAHAVAFSPDGSMVVSADGVGNLAWKSTIRAWDLPDGAERKLGSCIGAVGEFCFSLDGSRLAALANFSYLEAVAIQKATGASSVSQIHVWQVADEGKTLSINITDPRGRGVELWPPVKDAEVRSRIDATIQKIVPTKLRFSSDGKRLICETVAGLQTIYDSQTGKLLGPTKTCSVGMFMAMLVIALHEVPADVTEFSVDLRQSGSLMLIGRRRDGWWQASRRGKVLKDVFKVDGLSYVAIEGGVNKKMDIPAMLGLDQNLKLVELDSIKHPLGVIKISRETASLGFRLEDQKDGVATGTTLQRGEVRWAPKVKE